MTDVLIKGGNPDKDGIYLCLMRIYGEEFEWAVLEAVDGVLYPFGNMVDRHDKEWGVSTSVAACRMLLDANYIAESMGLREPKRAVSDDMFSSGSAMSYPGEFYLKHWNNK